jgi:hypothetical protein
MMTIRVETIDSHQITTERLSTYCEAINPKRTTSVSNVGFSGVCVPWDRFENEVRSNFLSQKWGNFPISLRLSKPGPNDLQEEMFLVGDEISLSGRFVQQVLHVMTAVGCDLNIPIRFGDFNTINPKEFKAGMESLRHQSASVLIQPVLDTDKDEDGNEKTVSPLSKLPDYVALDDRDGARFVGELRTPWTQNLSLFSENDQRWRRHLGERPSHSSLPNND